MRSKVSIVLVLCLLVGFCALPTLAQAQEQEPQLMAIWDIVVHPSKFMEFEAAMKEFVALYVKIDFPYAWTTYRTTDFHYYLVMPIKNYAAIDEFFNFSNKTLEKHGKEFEALMKSFAGTYESETFGTFYLRYDLSYIPENPRISLEDVNFVWWSFFYIIPGMESEAENISHDYQALYKSHGISDGWEIYMGAMWSDLPVLCVAGGAKSEADYHIQNEKNMQKFGDKYMALMKRTMDGTRKFEMKTGTILRELSYTPKER